MNFREVHGIGRLWDEKDKPLDFEVILIYIQESLHYVDTMKYSRIIFV